MRSEYWQQVKEIDPAHLVFIDEMGVLLGLTRTHARSPHGTRVYDRTYALTETHKRVFSPEALALRSQGQES